MTYDTDRDANQINVELAVAEAHRREWAYVLAATVRVTRDLDAAEEAVQEAFVRALRSWATSGVPRRPGAWLTTAARRIALNGIRRRNTLETKLPLLLVRADDGTPNPGSDEIPDDRLRLVFTCCHPALASEAQVALTLRMVCGVSTSDIAQAFLISESAMAARITRAKKKIATARIPYAVPSVEELPERVNAVLTVIYLLYSAGHTAHSGENLVRNELADRALDLSRMLVQLLPGEQEVNGLLALLLALHARRATRTDERGRLLRLEDQNRSLWDQQMIAEAAQTLMEALRSGPPGRFTLQAAIATLHAEARAYEQTDWPQILTLYDELVRAWPSPVVALNRAVALAMVRGPAEALAEIASLEQSGHLAHYRYLPATKAELLHRLGRDAEAVAAYRDALALTDNVTEQEFLADRVREITAPR